MNTVTDRTRGTRSERKLVVSLLRNGVDADDIFHDLYLEYRPGYYSQIDVVVVAQSGIIVFEDKDYSGWIFGSGWQKQWTQVLNYGKEKHHFYNPVKQNETHISHLRTALGRNAEGVPIISYIIFHGDCELHDISEIPSGVIVGYANRLGRNLREINELKPANYPDLQAVKKLLRQSEVNGRNPHVIRKHLDNVDRWK